MNTNALKMIYFSLVYSHLQYAIGVWGSATTTSQHRLNTIHNRIIKIMSWSSYRSHVTPIYGHLRLLKLADIYQLEIAKLMHSFHSGRMPNTFDHLFTTVSSVHSHHTRSSTSGQFFQYPACSNFGKKSLRFIGPRIWQCIDPTLKDLSIAAFKKQYRNLLIEGYRNPLQ